MAQTSIFRGVETKVYKQPDGRIEGFYRGTCVATLRANGSITLRDGGWLSRTTKTRMNQFSSEFCNNKFRVFARKGDWFVECNGKEYAYTDGFTIQG